MPRSTISHATENTTDDEVSNISAASSQDSSINDTESLDHSESRECSLQDSVVSEDEAESIASDTGDIIPNDEDDDTNSACVLETGVCDSDTGTPAMTEDTNSENGSDADTNDAKSDNDAQSVYVKTEETSAQDNIPVLTSLETSQDKDNLSRTDGEILSPEQTEVFELSKKINKYTKELEEARGNQEKQLLDIEHFKLKYEEKVTELYSKEAIYKDCDAKWRAVLADKRIAAADKSRAKDVKVGVEVKLSQARFAHSHASASIPKLVQKIDGLNRELVRAKIDEEVARTIKDVGLAKLAKKLNRPKGWSKIESQKVTELISSDEELDEQDESRNREKSAFIKPESDSESEDNLANVSDSNFEITGPVLWQLQRQLNRSKTTVKDEDTEREKGKTSRATNSPAYQDESPCKISGQPELLPHELNAAALQTIVNRTLEDRAYIQAVIVKLKEPSRRSQSSDPSRSSKRKRQSTFDANDSESEEQGARKRLAASSRPPARL